MCRGMAWQSQAIPADGSKDGVLTSAILKGKSRTGIAGWMSIYLRPCHPCHKSISSSPITPLNVGAVRIKTYCRDGVTPPLLLAFEQAMPRSSSSRSRSQGSLREQHTPRKRFGQHFLADRNIVNKIVRTAELEPSSVVLEIGPGLGHLTRALAQAGAQVVAVEVDRELAARLRTEFAETPNVHIVEGDVLTQAPIEWLREAGRQPPYIVVANLPYYITSAILRYLLEAPIPPTRIVAMVQREVAQQITARAPHSNLLAVSVQFYGTPTIVANVPAGAFRPPPQVDSAVVRIDVKGAAPAVNRKLFFQVVRAGFGARRKQLHNALEHGLKLSRTQVQSLLSRAGIAPIRRAETLTLEEWMRLARVFELLEPH